MSQRDIDQWRAAAVGIRESVWLCLVGVIPCAAASTPGFVVANVQVPEVKICIGMSAYTHSEISAW